MITQTILMPAVTGDAKKVDAKKRQKDNQIMRAQACRDLKSKRTGRAK
jgi:hypothetical protein